MLAVDTDEKFAGDRNECSKEKPRDRVAAKEQRKRQRRDRRALPFETCVANSRTDELCDERGNEDHRRASDRDVEAQDRDAVSEQRRERSDLPPARINLLHEELDAGIVAEETGVA